MLDKVHPRLQEDCSVQAGRGGHHGREGGCLR
jgi:hypothetical protein